MSFIVTGVVALCRMLANSTILVGLFTVII